MRIIRNSAWTALLWTATVFAQTFAPSQGGTGIKITNQTGCLFFTSGVPSIAGSCGSSSLSLTTTGTTGAATLSAGVLNVPMYQGALTLTTTGSSGAATLIGNTLNIPSYSGGAFSSLTGGTNTGAAMLVGTGASLGYTGSGIVNANQWAGYTLAGPGTAGYVPTVSASGAMTLMAPAATGITCLSGDVTTAGSGCTAATLKNVGTAGTYPLTGVINVDYAGRVLSVGPAFTISSFSCSASGNFEAGAATTNPNQCTFGYSGGTAVAATLTDSVPHTGTVVTPYTLLQLAYQYCTVSQSVSSFTFYGNASSSTQTAPQVTAGTNCLARIYAGTGTGGATSTGSATSSTTALVGATGTLSSVALNNSCNGQTFSVTTSGTQYVYFLGPCNVSNPGGGSFTIGTPSGPAFPFNVPTSFTFTNANGATYTQYLYQSVNSYPNGTSYTIVPGV